MAECKYCGKDGLRWEEEEDGSWTLVERNYTIHKCLLEKSAVLTSEDFDNLDGHK